MPKDGSARRAVTLSPASEAISGVAEAAWGAQMVALSPKWGQEQPAKSCLRPKCLCAGLRQRTQGWLPGAKAVRVHVKPVGRGSEQ